MRLIDADALIARVESDIKVIEDIEPQMAMGAIGVLNTIKKAPTASAVVRCKDCKTGKLNNPDESLLTEDSDACKEQKSKLDTEWTEYEDYCNQWQGRHGRGDKE